jgi:hypothetical protein
MLKVADRVMAMLAGHVDTDPAAKKVLANLLRTFASNYNAQRPKLLNDEERELLVNGVTAVRRYWHEKGDAWIDDVVGNGYIGWNDIPDDELLFEVLIENPIARFIPGNHSDEGFAHEHECLMLMRLMACPEVMALARFQEHLLWSEDNCLAYSNTCDYLHSRVLTSSEDTPAELKAEADRLATAFKELLDPIREEANARDAERIESAERFNP